jgi:isocitrate/isopropylmalate dehydrogenase
VFFFYKRRYTALANSVHSLFELVARNQPKLKGKYMADPLAQLTAIKTFLVNLEAANAALQTAANNATDTVSPDVQAAIDSIDALVTAAPVVTTPPAAS